MPHMETSLMLKRHAGVTEGHSGAEEMTKHFHSSVFSQLDEELLTVKTSSSPSSASFCSVDEDVVDPEEHTRGSFYFISCKYSKHSLDNGVLQKMVTTEKVHALDLSGQLWVWQFSNVICRV